MKKNKEKCQIAGMKINSATDLLENDLAAGTYRMQIVRDCDLRPRENGGPASLPQCRNGCPFYKNS